MYMHLINNKKQRKLFSVVILNYNGLFTDLSQL